jgi:hypothetical protein
VFDRHDFNATLFYPRDDTSPPPPGARDLFVDVGEAHVHVCRHAGTGAPMLLIHRDAERAVALAREARALYAKSTEPEARAVLPDRSVHCRKALIEFARG